MAAIQSPDTADTKKKRALVVGAGIAGLAAAFRLHRQGWEVLVVERVPPGAAAATW